MATERETAVSNAAIKPRRVQGDEGEVEMPPAGDAVEADRYIAKKEAASRQLGGVRFQRLNLPEQR